MTSQVGSQTMAVTSPGKSKAAAAWKGTGSGRAGVATSKYKWEFISCATVQFKFQTQSVFTVLFLETGRCRYAVYRHKNYWLQLNSVHTTRVDGPCTAREHGPWTRLACTEPNPGRPLFAIWQRFGPCMHYFIFCANDRAYVSCTLVSALYCPRLPTTVPTDLQIGVPRDPAVNEYSTIGFRWHFRNI